MKAASAQGLRFLVLTAVFLGVAAFSNWPRYRATPEGVGHLTLSFSHGADRRAACRRLSAEELAELPPNMRRTEICPRERPPVYVELKVDDETLFKAEVPPSGIAGDGPSRVFQRFQLPDGEYEVEVHLRDRLGDEGFNYSAEKRVTIEAAANRVIDFRPEAGGFVFY
jgi:hypothetical protein